MRCVTDDAGTGIRFNQNTSGRLAGRPRDIPGRRASRRRGSHAGLLVHAGPWRGRDRVHLREVRPARSQPLGGPGAWRVSGRNPVAGTIGGSGGAALTPTWVAGDGDDRRRRFGFWSRRAVNLTQVTPGTPFRIRSRSVFAPHGALPPAQAGDRTFYVRPVTCRMSSADNNCERNYVPGANRKLRFWTKKS